MEGQISISAEIIRHKAEYFWDIIYPGMEKPTFSNGWLHRFQARRTVKWHEQHGEAGDAPKQTEQEMVMIRQALSAYSPRISLIVMKRHFFGSRLQPGASQLDSFLDGKRRKHGSLLYSVAMQMALRN